MSPGSVQLAAGRLDGLQPHHRSRIAEILRATNAFRDEEIDVALELFERSRVTWDHRKLGGLY